MWTCPKCHRPFQRKAAWHICGEKSVDDIFADSPDNVLLAFDDVLLATAEWEPNSLSAGRHAAMLSNVQVWLVLRPAKKWLDLQFYTAEPLHSAQLHKTGPYSKKTKTKFVHVIRLHGGGELTEEQVDLLRDGYDYAMRRRKK